MTIPKLLSANRVQQLAYDNYLRAGFEKFVASGAEGLTPMTFNTPEDTLAYLQSTAAPLKVVFMGLDDALNEHGGKDVGGSTAYLVSFSEVEVSGEPDNRQYLKAVLAFFTDEVNTFLVYPEATYRRLPLAMETPNESSPQQYLCAPDDVDEILRILKEVQVLRTADVIPIKN
jgi:hypothetical protein